VVCFKILKYLHKKKFYILRLHESVINQLKLFIYYSFIYYSFIYYSFIYYSFIYYSFILFLFQFYLFYFRVGLTRGENNRAFSLSLKCIRISLNSLPYYFCVHDNLSLSKANMKDIHSI